MTFHSETPQPLTPRTPVSSHMPTETARINAAERKVDLANKGGGASPHLSDQLTSRAAPEGNRTPAGPACTAAQSPHLLPESAGRLWPPRRRTCPQKYLLSALIKPRQLLGNYQWASESEVREAGIPIAAGNKFQTCYAKQAGCQLHLGGTERSRARQPPHGAGRNQPSAT